VCVNRKKSVRMENKGQEMQNTKPEGVVSGAKMEYTVHAGRSAVVRGPTSGNSWVRGPTISTSNRQHVPGFATNAPKKEQPFLPAPDTSDLPNIGELAPGA